MTKIGRAGYQHVCAVVRAGQLQTVTGYDCSGRNGNASDLGGCLCCFKLGRTVFGVLACWRAKRGKSSASGRGSRYGSVVGLTEPGSQRDAGRRLWEMATCAKRRVLVSGIWASCFIQEVNWQALADPIHSSNSSAASLNDHALAGCHESTIIVTCADDRCQQPRPCHVTAETGASLLLASDMG